MATFHPLPPIGITFLVLLFLISLPPTTLSQDPNSPGTTIADCTPRLLPLAACAPFVQGTVQSPVQSCCDNLKQVYNLEPHCVCLLLNDTTLSSFPINTTLALQLPVLCNLQVNTSACSGLPIPPTPSSSPGSQISLGAISNSTHGTNSNSTVAASPMAPPGPPKHPGIMGLGFGHSNGMKLETEGGLAVVVAMVAFLQTKILYQL